MIWLVKNWKLTLSAIAVLSALGAFWYHGHAEYRKGYNKALSDNTIAHSEERKNNSDIWNEVRHENSKITDLDAAANRLGILRPDENR